MNHPGFFDRHGPFSLADIWRLALGGEMPAALTGQASQQYCDIRALDDATPDHLSFLDNPRYLPQLAQTRAGACFVHPRYAERLPADTLALPTPEPYRAYATALALFYPDAMQPAALGHSPEPAHGGLSNGLSAIAPSAILEPGVIVECGAVIGPEAQVGAGSRIGAGAVIGRRVTLGRNCAIGARAVITNALIGNRVIVHPGAAIGQDGFGFAMGRAGHLKVPQIGRVIIQDDVEIGANTTIDRGALKDTVIGEGTKIDNLVQIGHNVVVGRHCIIVGQVGISGSTVLGDFVVMGGQAGTIGHITIGSGAQIAGSSGVAEDIPAGERWGGSPARPFRAWAREVAAVKRLAETLSPRAKQDMTDT